MDVCVWIDGFSFHTRSKIAPLRFDPVIHEIAGKALDVAPASIPKPREYKEPYIQDRTDHC